MDDYENEALPVGEAQVAEAMQTLQRYKAGKAALDKRIVDNELWFRMGHWKNYQNPMMPGKAQPSSGWLFNSIANKHADAMDNYPEPNVLPREALFCKGLHWTEHLLTRSFRNPWLRVLAGAAILIVLSLLTNGDYNGAGMDVIVRALRGDVSGWAWLWKLLFTAVTIGCGFKGGEVVPSFFVGAAFGCFMGGLLGLPAGFAAAIGLVAVFCGAVNCPVASVLLSVELFGSAGAPYFAVACALSYLLSGYCGLYSSQTILYSKLRAEFINVRTHE